MRISKFPGKLHRKARTKQDFEKIMNKKIVFCIKKWPKVDELQIEIFELQPQ